MVILEVGGMSFRYPSLDVIDNVSFSVESGKCVAILGMNGVGKSTMLKCINRILNMSEGAVMFGDKSLEDLSSNDLAKEVSYVTQKAIFPNTTVFDTVLLGRKPYIVWDSTKSDHEKVKAVLRELSLENYALRNVNYMSGGEAQKVAIARAIVQETNLMLLDEPTSNLDLKNQLEVVNIIRNVVKERNVAAIVTMHDINLALRFADEFIMLKDRKIHAIGGPESVTPESIKEVYGVDVRIEEIGGHTVVVPI